LKREPEAAAYFARQQLGLIEPAAPPAKPVERHRDNDVELSIVRQRPDEIPAQRSRKRWDALELEQMNEPAQRAFVKAVTIRAFVAG
jgi:hypothetical protein